MSCFNSSIFHLWNQGDLLFLYRNLKLWSFQSEVFYLSIYCAFKKCLGRKQLTVQKYEKWSKEKMLLFTKMMMRKYLKRWEVLLSSPPKAFFFSRYPISISNFFYPVKRNQIIFLCHSMERVGFILTLKCKSLWVQGLLCNIFIYWYLLQSYCHSGLQIFKRDSYWPNTTAIDFNVNWNSV